MAYRGLLAIGLILAVAGCGSTTTRTVTKTTTGTSSVATTTPTTPTTPTTTPAVTTVTSTPSQPVYFKGAAGTSAQRPSTLELTGDGTLEVQRVQWTSWGGATATGSGNAEYHGCTPDCAAAPVHTALVSIRLSGVRACGGRRYYAGVTLTLSSGRLLDEKFLQQSWSPC